MLDINHVYTISEVSELTGYAPHVLRYYEKEFEIDIPRTDSNHRYYTYKEIELIQYIKMLQDKGFGNKQIKLIISSPELILNTENGTSLAKVEDNNYLDTYEIAQEITQLMGDEFFNRLSACINQGNAESIKLIEELKEEIIVLRQELNSKDRDILICENAKLKMRLKEKTYENIELNDKLRKMEDQKVGFFKRIFNNN